MLKQIVKLIVALNGNAKRSQIAAGFAWGLLLGLVPVGNFFWIVLFLVSFFFKHNHGSKLLAMVIVKLLSPLIAPPLDLLGWEVLHIESLEPLYTSWYNMPFVPFTRFNNTLVAGGLVGGIVLFIPAFIVFFGLVALYRKTIARKLRESKLVKGISAFFAKIPFLNKIIDAVSAAANKG
jgi:uncharacterized protein (TIGR03546 family)